VNVWDITSYHHNICQDAATFGIPIAKMNDHLMGKRFGIKELPGLVLFRRGRHIKYEDDLEDELESISKIN
jgi:hypothetical protein